MVNEVNNIVFNTLLSERAINLPEVGTLSVVQQSASMTSSSTIAPPSCRIEFSSHAKATSLIDAIAAAGNVDIDTAEDIYCRWLAKIKSGSTIQIDGVGTLRDKSFVAESSFLALFNSAEKPVKVKYQRNKGVAVALVATFIGVAIVAGAAAWFFYSDMLTITFSKLADNVTNLFNTQPVQHPIDSNIEEVAVESIEPAEAVIEEVAIVTTAVVEEWTVREDIHHWVVVGSYSNMENAEKAIRGIESKYKEIKCKTFPLGKMFAVAIFGSNTYEECAEYKQKYSSDFEQAWIFTPKEYR